MTRDIGTWLEIKIKPDLQKLFHIFHVHSTPSHADSYAITSQKSIMKEEEKNENIWNPHYAFSRIVETWLDVDGTFNKFLAYGVCRYQRRVGSEKYQLMVFKWGRGLWVLILMWSGWKIFPLTIFWEGENWNLPKLLFMNHEHAASKSFHIKYTSAHSVVFENQFAIFFMRIYF